MAFESGAVVEMVSVTGTVVVDELKVTFAGLKLQVLSGGKPMHNSGESGKVPAKPFWAEKVNVVVADWPGAPMVMVAVAGVTANAPPTSIKVAAELDPLKLASPLY
jgi:hypothetical protein